MERPREVRVAQRPGSEDDDPRGLRERAVQRVLDAARRVVGARGVDGTALLDIAAAAGVPLGLLRYHFRSMDHLLIETQRATFRQIHERFEERFARGEVGLDTALEALDALWASVRELHAWAPFMVQTMALAARDPSLAHRLDAFNAENLTRVELGLIRALPQEAHRLVLPPERLARTIRTGLYGLVVELASARDDAERAAIDRTYADVRAILARIVLEPEPGGPPVH
ncbi:MAG: TetR/AcrR family transcriptional regulator [Alphaproteobacteria bacterium]|nr:TetR/AcrR family transcriptional regulator [Alphaproteobacteria bacterium]